MDRILKPYQIRHVTYEEVEKAITEIYKSKVAPAIKEWNKDCRSRTVHARKTQENQ